MKRFLSWWHTTSKTRGEHRWEGWSYAFLVSVLLTSISLGVNGLSLVTGWFFITLIITAWASLIFLVMNNIEIITRIFLDYVIDTTDPIKQWQEKNRHMINHILTTIRQEEEKEQKVASLKISSRLFQIDSDDATQNRDFLLCSLKEKGYNKTAIADIGEGTSDPWLFVEF